MKKVIALLLLLSMLISSNAVSASTSNNGENQDSSSTYYEQAVILSKINILRETSTGYELDRQPTRLEGLIMLIRLLGKESEVNAYKNEVSIFNDVPEWGMGYVNYAYKVGLTKGLTADKFGTNDKISVSAYMTYMLRALGYDDSNGDFVWSASVEKAKEISLIDEQLYNELLSETFTRNEVAIISYNTLLSNIKNNNQILAELLIDKGSINKQTALDIGIIKDDYTYLLSHVTSVVVDGGLAEPLSLKDSEMIVYAVYERKSDIDKFLSLSESDQKMLLNDIVVKILGSKVINKTIFAKVILDSYQYASMDVLAGQDYSKVPIKILKNGEKLVVIKQFVNNLGEDEFTYYYTHSFPLLGSGNSNSMFKNSILGSKMSDVEKDNLDLYQMEKNDKQLWYIETINKTDLYLIYSFENGELTGVDYHIAEMLNKNNCFETFDIFKELLDKQYGSKGELGQTWKNEQYKNDTSNWNTAIAQGQLYYSSSWEVRGCQVDLVLISSGDGEIDLFFAYR